MVEEFDAPRLQGHLDIPDGHGAACDRLGAVRLHPDDFFRRLRLTIPSVSGTKSSAGYFALRLAGVLVFAGVLAFAGFADFFGAAFLAMMIPRVAQGVSGLLRNTS
jgi:hypothetical protein